MEKDHHTGRVYTHHGKKKNQGMLAKVNNELALTYTEDDKGIEKVVGYTTVTELIEMASAQKLKEFKVNF